MSRRFNPPPGWPEPEPGWTPPPGWTPDVSWPSAPPTWSFWVYDDPTPVRQFKRAYLGPVGTHPIRKLVRGSLIGFFALMFIAAMFGSPKPAQSQQAGSSSNTPSPSGTPSPTPTEQLRPPGVPTKAQRVTIEDVVDGQSVHVHVNDGHGRFRGNARLTVALSGVSAPMGSQCHSQESADDLRTMLPAGATAYAAATDDGSSTEAQIWDATGTLINQSIVAGGDAKASLSADTAVTQAQAQAKSAQLGVWSTACVKPKPKPAPTPSEEPIDPSPGDGGSSGGDTGDDGGDDSSTGGASAVCHDGSLSYSQHRSGTCSHHGGVAKWL